MYSFAEDPHCTIQSQRQNGVWAPKLLFPLSQMAQQKFQQLMMDLQLVQLNGDGDKREMTTIGKEPTTADFYKLFCDHGQTWQPHKWIWHKAVPHKQKIFLWLAFRGRPNTKDNMTAKCWSTDAGCDQCPALESIHHIALHCRAAAWVWNKLGLSQYGGTSNSISEFVEKIQNVTANKTWTICFATCIWELWKARNDRVINGRKTTKINLAKQIAQDLKLWTCRSREGSAGMLLWTDKLL
uniref:Uncharacterized protein n=1 Tax=Avena sativa TaxID=4498 RepID=A0ACD5W9A8_AVESA